MRTKRTGRRRQRQSWYGLRGGSDQTASAPSEAKVAKGVRTIGAALGDMEIGSDATAWRSPNHAKSWGDVSTGAKPPSGTALGVENQDSVHHGFWPHRTNEPVT